MPRCQLEQGKLFQVGSKTFLKLPTEKLKRLPNRHQIKRNFAIWEKVLTLISTVFETIFYYL
jgi:hypothetical protein